MVNFLNPNDPDAFLDWPPPLDRPANNPNSKLCPVCYGHGGWNSLVNAYPLHNHEDTQKNRHEHVHFRAHCTQCHGYGWTNSDCIHEFMRSRNVGRCLNEYTCVKCQKKEIIDSGD